MEEAEKVAEGGELNEETQTKADENE